MKQILFATAYTPQAKAAFRYAQKLAQYFEASITLAHIYKPQKPILPANPELISDDLLEDPNLTEDEIWEREQEKLQTFAASLAAKQFQDIPLDFIVSEGNVIAQLGEIQRNNNFDLIVMGMRKHNLGDRLFGNITYKVIDAMECPILLVPPDVTYKGIDKILYGTALQSGEAFAINHLLDWCQAFGATVDIVHVFNEKIRQLSEEKIAALESNYPEEIEGQILSFVRREGNILSVLENQLHLSGADLLVIHKRKKGFWNRFREDSLTEKLSERLDIPLLVFKSKSELTIKQV